MVLLPKIFQFWVYRYALDSKTDAISLPFQCLAVIYDIYYLPAAFDICLFQCSGLF